MVEFNPNISIEDLEKEYILKAMEFYKGNKTQAALSLGITIKTLYNKLHSYEQNSYLIKDKFVPYLVKA